MKRLLLICALTIAPGARADHFPHKIWHYAATHKELLAYDAVAILGPMADASSSVHCFHFSTSCTEFNGLLSRRPSNVEAYGAAAGASVSLIAVGHLVWYFVPGRTADRQVLIWIAVPVAIGTAIQTKNNISVANQIK